MLENPSFQGYFTEVSFDTSVGNQLSYFQNGYFSKNLWWFHEPHNQVKCTKEYTHCRFLVPDNTQKILTEIWHHFWLKNDDEKWSRKKYFEIPRWPSEIPANLPGQFSLSGQIFLHWAAATLKGHVGFQNKKI